MSDHEKWRIGPSSGLALASLELLLRAATRFAEGLSVSDRQAKKELIDALAIAGVNVARLRVEAGFPRRDETLHETA